MAPLSRGINTFLKNTLLRSCHRSVSRNNVSLSQLVISPEISEAISNGMPVVSLESTIITHGMPYPTNYQMAKDVEGTIRDNGAIPATIAIIGGNIHVGLSNGQLEELAEMKKKAIKTSRRDFPYVISKKVRWQGNQPNSNFLILDEWRNYCLWYNGCIEHGWIGHICNRRDWWCS